MNLSAPVDFERNIIVPHFALVSANKGWIVQRHSLKHRRVPVGRRAKQLYKCRAAVDGASSAAVAARKSLMICTSLMIPKSSAGG